MSELFPSMSNAERYAKVLKHLNPLFKQSVRDKGSPFAKSISYKQAAILMQYLEMPEIMGATLDDIMESINVAVDAGVAWAPWHLTGVLQKQRLAAYKASRVKNRDTATNAFTRPIVKTSDVRYEPERQKADNKADRAFAGKLMSKHNKAQRRKVVKWAIKRTGSMKMREFIAYRILAKVIRERK